MKKDFSNLCFSLAGLATIAVPQTVQADESLPYWKDIQVVSVNREEPRSAFMTYANKTQALTGDYEKKSLLPAAERNLEVLLHRFLQTASG